MSTIQITTSRFGTINVDGKNIIEFVSPIIGFEGLTRYTLLDHADNSPFKWLQSLDEPSLAFVVTNPKFFAIPYEFMLPEDTVHRLGIKQVEDVLVFTIVNIPNENPGLMTANLLAPIVVNQANLHAMQVVLQDTQYTTRTRLLPDTAKGQESSESASAQKGKG